MQASTLRRRGAAGMLSLAWLLALLLGACRSSGSGAHVHPSPFGAWKLVWLEGSDRAALVGAGAPRPELVLGSDGALAGHGGVNRISGSVEALALARGRFQTSPLATTRMAGPPAAMELEGRFLRALTEADEARVEGGELVLSRGSMPLARFERTEAPARAPEASAPGS